MLAQSVQVATDSTVLTIHGIDEPVVLQYFNTFNQGNFAAVSLLFAKTGVLQAPFEDKIEGATAIAAYLEREAKGFVLQPQHGTATALGNGDTEFEVIGRVQTPMFSINVSWLFILNSFDQLAFVKVKLLASMQELLHFRK